MLNIPTPTRLAIVALLGTCLAACGTVDRIKNIGQAPDMSPIGDVAAPATEGSISAPTSLVDAQSRVGQRLFPARPEDTAPNASLWRTGARAFFSDQRASRVGDILTVQIQIDDDAQVGNTTRRTRSNSEDAGLENFFGLESQLSKVLPNAVDPANLIGADSASSSVGDGSVQRSETINLTVAAIVTQVLPNGNLVIQGRQEVRVNFEVRDLVIAGIVRPQDITNANTIDHTQIAEARISYGGRGHLTDVQQARYGQQLYDILFPF